VETQAQFEFLRRHGCEEAQGFLFSRALPHDQLRAWWRAREDGLTRETHQADLWRVV